MFALLLILQCTVWGKEASKRFKETGKGHPYAAGEILRASVKKTVLCKKADVPNLFLPPSPSSQEKESTPLRHEVLETQKATKSKKKKKKK